MVLKCITDNVNIFVYIVCDAKESILKKRQNATVAWKFVHIVVILKMSWIKE